MKQKLTFLVVLFSVCTCLTQIADASLSKREFARNLREAVGNKRGNGAILAVVRELKEGLAEKPKAAAAFTRLSNNALRRLVNPNQRSKAAAALVKALGVSYFRGPNRYDPEDPVFHGILVALVNSLPAELKTDQGIAPIISGLTKLNKIRKGSPEDLQLLVDLVRSTAGLPAIP